MICSFYNKQEAVEVIPLCLEQNEVTDDYTLKVVGLDSKGNYTNAGQLTLTEKESNELIENHVIDDMKQLIGRKVMIVSNALCKEADIQHLNTALTPDEWQTLQPFIEKHNNPLGVIEDGEELDI